MEQLEHWKQTTKGKCSSIEVANSSMWCEALFLKIMHTIQKGNRACLHIMYNRLNEMWVCILIHTIIVEKIDKVLLFLLKRLYNKKTRRAFVFAQIHSSLFNFHTKYNSYTHTYHSLTPTHIHPYVPTYIYSRVRGNNRFSI